jgi:hypothetical protein
MIREEKANVNPLLVELLWGAKEICGRLCTSISAKGVAALGLFDAAVMINLVGAPCFAFFAKGLDESPTSVGNLGTACCDSVLGKALRRGNAMLEEQSFNGVARLARMWRGTDYDLFDA